MKHFFQTCLSLWIILLVTSLSQVKTSYAAGSLEQCDLAAFTELEADFQQMVRRQAEYPGLFSETEYKAAALTYLLIADHCYYAFIPANSRTNSQSPTGPIIIDNGGEWAPGLFPPGSEPFVTFGNKWGPGSPYGGGPNQGGPGLAGGTVTYSYMKDGVSHGAEGVGSNVDARTGLGVDQCLETEIASALAAWSAIADIQFVQVTDTHIASDGLGAVGDIRIGAHFFDGPGGILAHAFFPPPNGPGTIAGDLHFDLGETWACNSGPSVIDVGFVALHEIGHAIGLSHEPPVSSGGQLAVMNPFYNPTLTGLQPDDITGAASIYGVGQPLTLSKTLLTHPAAVTSAAIISYKLKIQNLNSQPVTNITLHDTLPAGVTYVPGSAAANPAIVNLSGFPNSIPPFTINGQSSLEITYNVEIGPANQGDLLINIATVDAPTLPQPVQTTHTAIVDPYLIHLPIILKTIS